MKARSLRRVLPLAVASAALTTVAVPAASGLTRATDREAAAAPVDPMSPFVLGQGTEPVSVAAPFGTAVVWMSSSDGHHADQITTCRMGQGVRHCTDQATLTAPAGVSLTQVTLAVNGAVERVVAVGCCAGDGHGGSFATSIEWISTDSGLSFSPPVEQTLGDDSTASIAPDGSVWTVNAQSPKGLIVQHQPAGLSTPTTAETKISTDLVGVGPRGRFAFLSDGMVLLASQDLTTKAVVVFRYDGSTWTQVLNAPGEQLNDLSDAFVPFTGAEAYAYLFTQGTGSGLGTSLILRNTLDGGRLSAPTTVEPTAYYYRAMLVSDASAIPHFTWYLAGDSVLRAASSNVYPWQFYSSTLAKVSGVAAEASIGPWTETLDVNGAGLFISASGPSLTGSIVAIPVLLKPTFLQLLHRYTTHTGGKVVVHTTMPTMPPGTKVALQLKGRHGFATIARTTVTTRHAVSFTLRPNRPGSKTYRLEVPGRAGVIEPRNSTAFVVTAKP